jgi:hypothetical protein
LVPREVMWQPSCRHSAHLQMTCKNCMNWPKRNTKNLANLLTLCKSPIFIQLVPNFFNMELVSNLRYWDHRKHQIFNLKITISIYQLYLMKQQIYCNIKKMIVYFLSRFLPQKLYFYIYSHDPWATFKWRHIYVTSYVARECVLRQLIA